MTEINQNINVYSVTTEKFKVDINDTKKVLLISWDMTACFYAINMNFFRDVSYYRKAIYTEDDILNYFSSEKLKNIRQVR